MMNLIKRFKNYIRYVAAETKYFLIRINPFRKTETIDVFLDDDVIKFIKGMSKELNMSGDNIINFILWNRLKAYEPLKSKKKQPKKKKGKTRGKLRRKTKN